MSHDPAHSPYHTSQAHPPHHMKAPAHYHDPPQQTKALHHSQAPTHYHNVSSCHSERCHEICLKYSSFDFTNLHNHVSSDDLYCTITASSLKGTMQQCDTSFACCLTSCLFISALARLYNVCRCC